MKWKYFGNKSYKQEHTLEPVNGVGHGGFLQDVLITFTKNTDEKDPIISFVRIVSSVCGGIRFRVENLQWYIPHTNTYMLWIF